MKVLGVSKQDWIKVSCCEFLNPDSVICACGSESNIKVCTKKYSLGCRYAIEKRRKQDKNNN